MMPGGPREAYEAVRPIFEAIAAQADGARCVAYLGAGSCGHYVKMVHNGIEYGLMQLISEAYALLRRGLGLDNGTIAATFAEWQAGELESYLVEITAAIFRHTDEQTGMPLIDLILGEAAQKGTGMWTSQHAMDLHVPVPNIDVAVSMRNLSGLLEQRTAARETAGGETAAGTAANGGAAPSAAERPPAHRRTSATPSMPPPSSPTSRASPSCSRRPPPRATTWLCATSPPSGAGAASSARCCCATSRRPSSGSRICPPCSSTRTQPSGDRPPPGAGDLAGAAMAAGIPIPGLMTALSYLDAYLADWLPTNLIQAQRDYFGAHTYRRVDKEGIFHTDWEEAR